MESWQEGETSVLPSYSSESLIATRAFQAVCLILTLLPPAIKGWAPKTSGVLNPGDDEQTHSNEVL